MDQHERDKWKSMRTKGMAHFILINGVVKMGGALFLVVSVAGNILLRRQWLAEELVSEATVCLIGGLVFGIVLWLINEMRYWWSP
jgi:hypothetical protein